MSSFNDARSIYANSLARLALLAMILALFGCAQRARDANEPADPRWSAIIAAHTVGPVPRKSEIRIVFNQDVVAAAQVGKQVDQLLRSDPKIEGKAVFSSPRELIWTPSKELEGGRTYRIELAARGLLNVPETLEPYAFDVRVQAPEFDVTLDALRAEFQDGDASARMWLSGEIVTADIEAADRVERLIKGEYLNQPLKLQWEHGANGRAHRFTTSVARQSTAQTITLNWDGASIGSANKGQRQIEVPARNEFRVTGVNVSGDATERQIHIVFTGVLARDQDLRGLVQLSRGTPRFRIESNLLRVYVDNDRQGEVEGDVIVTIAAGVRSESGATLASASQHPVTFVSQKPQLRFVGGGVILPEADRITVPIEAVNLRAVRITAFRVYEDNLPQFLQVNALDGQRELARVGRNLWRKHIRLTTADAKSAARWQRYALDVTELMRKYPGSLVRLNVSFARSDIVYDCPGLENAEQDVDAPPRDAETGDEADASFWDYYEDEFGSEEMNWNERDNPCKRAYYTYSRNIRASRNLLVSNLGLIAKRDQLGKLLIVATDLRTSEPLAGARITALNFQNQTLAEETTQANGMAEFKPNGTPYLLIAEKGGQKGYLRVAPGVSLPVSHFDVGGEQVTGGLKATMYGERGVWRPGDDIHLTLALQDPTKSIPKDHPVKLEFFDPRNQLMQTLVNDKPVGGFYAFTLKTNEDAPTGEWTAKATLGGNTFTKTVRVETVMPNRLKMDLQMPGIGADAVLDASRPIKGTLSAQWLTGALAANLHADVALRLGKASTTFTRNVDFVFDDPTREFSTDPQTLFDGALDDRGRATFDELLKFEKQAPGMLNATFVTRVFEPSGAFSITRHTQTVSPYSRYVGLKLPKGDTARNMLLTDTPHVVELASVDAAGKPVAIENIHVTVYKIGWRWWWDQSGESLAQFASSPHVHMSVEGNASTANGAGQWSFAIKYPEWGRYLIRACDTAGGHCAANVFYIDWPYWAGRPQDQSGPGANMLAVTTDKPEYRVGEVAKIDLPEGAQGRALVTIENGSRILDARWIEAGEKSRRVELPLTAAMTPNVYVNVTLIQPHSGKNNDRPIRMYGIVPIKVTDPNTHLQPQVQVPVEWAPESKATIKVSEAQGRAMHYTLAVVDEGLLGLTNFKTPNLHEHFYKREALGVATWDLFDQVAGAYGADLERLLALGGSDAASTDPDKNKSRFPPVVKFLGPFELAAGKSATHEVMLPKYVGAVRVMVVAGATAPHHAYGSAEKSVFVRQPLMILPTLPRVVGPNEEITVPVSVFAMDASIKQAQVSIEGDALFAVDGARSTTVTFTGVGEQLALLRIKSAARIGQGTIKFTAASGGHRASASVNLAVRSPNTPTLRYEHRTLKPGETWNTRLAPHGLLGTNTASLEVSVIPPLNLERRLEYLIRYPHGCLEQTTSAMFPQLFLPQLVRLDDSRKREIESNINNGIARLRLLQQAHGGFSYWPGYNTSNDGFDPRAVWSSSYVGHFLIEAERLGYHVPATMRSGWLNYQRSAVQAWTPTQVNRGNHILDQAYRLYTLALAGQAEVGAMNRLRETANIPLTARWMLAAAYHLAGMSDAAQALINNYKLDKPEQIAEYDHPDDTFGSRLRDQAVVLHAMVSMGRINEAQPLVRAVSERLSSEFWYSTHSLSYSLLAISKFIGADHPTDGSGIYSFEHEFAGKRVNERSDAPVSAASLGALPNDGAPFAIKNTSKQALFVTVVTRGVLPPGESEAKASGLSLDVEYVDQHGNAIDIAKLSSGTDLVARITVRNNEPFTVKNIALTYLVPSGWEIMNDRLDNAQSPGERQGDSRRYWEDWYYSLYTRARDKTEYLDIRDDRVQRYFALQAGERVTFVTRINAAYMGKFWLPGVHAEAMYDAARNAQTAGQWVTVSERGK